MKKTWIIKTILVVIIFIAISNIKVSAQEVNTFNKDTITKFDLRTKSGLTLEEVNYLLSRFKNLNLGDKIFEIEEEYGINAYFLISIIREESANGKSWLAVNKNNLGGIKGVNGKFRGFETKEQCLEYMADLLSTKYLNKDGKYFNGYTLKDVNKRYCEGTQWQLNIEEIMLDMKKSIDDYNIIEFSNVLI